MEQQQLRTLEATCIQEEQPYCTAACPIHIDVRAFMGSLARGDLRGARRVLDRTMPFADIVGRICDAPCRRACKRQEIGDPLAIGGLERFCVTNQPQVVKSPRLPAKGGKVAIIGSGLSGMTAALDLSRKGRQAVMFTTEKEMGGSLRTFPEKLLPAAILAGAAETLQSYGVEIVAESCPDKAAFEKISAEYDALYLDRDSLGPEAFGLDLSTPDPLTLGLYREGLFAGGGQGAEGFSVIRQVEEGRRGALSIERFLQKVSLTAQREREGSGSTRLFTSTEGIAPAEEVRPADSDAGFSSEEAAAEAHRCLQCQCLECVKQCVFLREFDDYPKKLVRKIYNNEAIVQGTRTANRMINSCMLCSQCTVICPHDFPMARVCRQTRENMTASSTMPPSAHEFALDDMAFSLGEFFALTRHQPGHTASGYVFYPGCQLAGSAPETVEKTYDYLCRELAGGVGLILGCCGIPARWAGRRELFEQTVQTFTGEVARLGNPMVITACTSCHAVFKEFAPDLALRSIWQILEKAGLPEDRPAFPAGPLAIHDPCGVREEPRIRASARAIARKIGINIREQKYSGELTDCCGYGGLLQIANPGLGQKAARVKAERSEQDGLAYCAMCRDNLAASGRKTAHLLDYLFGDPGGDPLLRANPGYSRRYENRARLKHHLLTRLWQEEALMTPEYKDMKLIISPQVMELLDKRHILEEDLQKVIFQAEKTGRGLVDPRTGHLLASHRPVRVTFWVEYEKTDDGYVIHNAYSHRMILPDGEAS